MGVIEEESPHIQSGSKNCIHKNKPYDQEEGEGNKVINRQVNGSEIIMSLTDLPPDVLVEILAMLPLRTIFVARSVCKTLTTSNPHFINLHSFKAAHILVFQFRVSDTPSCLLRMADNELDYTNSQPKPPLFQLPEKGNYFLVNSCNGLLYFVRPKHFHSFVCNPVTSEYIIIPDAVTADPRMSLWLGFSPSTDQYKVLRIFHRKNPAGPDEIAAQVYVIGSDSDSWRDIVDTPQRRRFLIGNLGRALVNGLMYCLYQSCSGVIISFDFEREKIGEVAFPDEEFTTTMNEKNIGVLGGCFCLSCNVYYSHRLDLWVMRKFGNQESWRKEFVIDTAVGPRAGPVFGQFKPLQFLRNGEILMQWVENALVCYDPTTDTLRYFRLHKEDLSHKVMSLTPSFVPLKDALKVEKVLTQSRPRGDEKEL